MKQSKTTTTTCNVLEARTITLREACKPNKRTHLLSLVYCFCPNAAAAVAAAAAAVVFVTASLLLLYDGSSFVLLR